MKYKIELKNGTVWARTAAEALELLRLAEQSDGSGGAATFTHASAGLESADHQAKSPVTQTRSIRNLRKTLSFLQLIASAQGCEVEQSELMKVFNIDNPKALGAKIGMVNATLRALGRIPDDVYYSERSPDGNVLMEGPSLYKAIEACQEVLIGPEE